MQWVEMISTAQIDIVAAKKINVLKTEIQNHQPCGHHCQYIHEQYHMLIQTPVI